jgi:long-chain fatty acid transport protein
MGKLALICFVVLFVPVVCFASGYALYEMNANGLAQAHALICRVDDPSAVWYNPAALTKLEGTQVYASGTWIHTSGEYTSLAGNSLDMEKGNFFPPNIYVSHQLSDDLVIAGGFYVPFGLTTEWPQDSSLSYVSQRAELQTFYFTPSVAYKFTPNISIGGGLDLAFANVNLRRKISLAPLYPVTFDNEIDGDGKDFGFNLGALIRTNKNLDFAITYKHKIDIDFDGNATFTNVPGMFRAAFPDGPASVTLPMPSQLMFGASTTYENWSFEGNITWAKWSDFAALSVDFQNNTPFLRDQVTLRNYEDSWAIRFGVEYKFNEAIRLRGGYVYDQTPVPDKAVDPILPDGSRNGVALGLGYDQGAWRLDIGYQALFFAERNSPLDNYVNPPGNLIAAGKYKDHANLLAFGLGYKF